MLLKKDKSHQKKNHEDDRYSSMLIPDNLYTRNIAL